MDRDHFETWLLMMVREKLHLKQMILNDILSK